MKNGTRTLIRFDCCDARLSSEMGSKADLTAPKYDFCFTPVSGHRLPDRPCPKGANNGSGQPYSMVTYSAPQIPTPKTEHDPLARLKYRIAFRRLSRHPCQHDCFLRRYPKIPCRLQ